MLDKKKKRLSERERERASEITPALRDWIQIQLQ